MQDAISFWGVDGQNVWNDGAVGFGQLRLHDTPEACNERLPHWLPEQRLAFTAEARIDNRDELCDFFRIPHAERPTTPDSALILQAYLKWGEACPEYLLGDWSFAVWYPDEQRLFLARDHHGVTALYYYQDATRFAFASSRKALLALGVQRRLNEMYLAQVLIAWPAYHGERTIDLDIYRLPPAHAMTVTRQGTKVWRYWRLEDTPELHLPGFQDYIDGFLEVYTEAVRCRLRSQRPVGVTLSGGLDSGSVTALAARELQSQGKRLPAFTAVPMHDGTASANAAERFGDESELARATADFAENVDVNLTHSEEITPLAGIRRSLYIYDEPQFGAANAYWIWDLLTQVSKTGIGVLLTGQGGNATISWPGNDVSVSWRNRIARHGVLKTMRHVITQQLPSAWQRAFHGWQIEQRWQDHAALNPDFARRIALREAICTDKVHPLIDRISDPRERRYRIIKPGRSIISAWWAESGAATGLSVRDPTEDVRVMQYCLSIPDRFYRESSSHTDRWLIRSSMQGLLPDAVRLNQRRGRQSSDLLQRLRHDSEEVDRILAQAVHGRAAEYLDIARMKSVWHQAQTENSPEVRRLSSVILLRSIMAGIFLSDTALVN